VPGAVVYGAYRLGRNRRESRVLRLEDPAPRVASVFLVAIEVRTIDASEFAQWVACKDLVFLHSRREQEAFAQFLMRDMELDRTWAAIDHGASANPVVGTLATFRSRLTVPGPGESTASAVTGVTVAPTHRRRGLLTEMISGELIASVERCEPLAILIAAEYPIYGRFGFGHAVDSASYSIDTREVRFRREGVGDVELVDLATLRKEAPAVFDAFRMAQPGSIDRNDFWWDRTLHQVDVPGEEPPMGSCALYRSPSGEVQGYLQYQAEPRVDAMRPKGVLNVEELVSVTPEAYQRLWQFCCEVDLVSTVNASDRSVDEPLPWLLTDGRAVRQSARFDFLWVRVLDVCSALSARRYQLEGRLVIDVADQVGFAGGRYALEGGPAGAQCSRTTEKADLALGIGALGSLYLGGPSLRTLAAGGEVEELSPGAVARADSMFSNRPVPWCSTWF
jgi:predicted acetyltransferase